MTRTTRFHVDSMPESSLTPKHLTKQEFGRRLYKFMMSRAWNQSELARQANLPRDIISTYIRGIALPTPKSLEALATAPNAAWLRVNRLVSLSTAARVIELIEADIVSAQKKEGA